MNNTDATDETYDAKLSADELVKHHVYEEEHEMFKEAKDLMDESELEQLEANWRRPKNNC
ncbi:MAG: hypothetical protein M3Z14_03135 [Candidatus Eremiobacteraeota bacterium]|nr:hypothetical protein [Candidatus Eremiobacteraeota bacterium]